MVGAISICHALSDAGEARSALVSDREVTPNAFISGLYRACQSGVSQMPHWTWVLPFMTFSLAASAIIWDQVQLSVGYGRRPS